MRYILTIAFIFCFWASNAQSVGVFGKQSPNDTSKTGGQLVVPVLASSDSNKVIGVTSSGHFVLRTKSNGISFDTTGLLRKRDTSRNGIVVTYWVLDSTNRNNVKYGDTSTVIATRSYVNSQGYITGNQTITLSGDASGSGTTSVPVTVNKLNGQFPSHYLDRANHTGTQAFSTLTGTPTTLSGYGITDATSTARAAISSTATGLTYTSGTGVFSLTSGYSIPTTTNQTNWTTAYTNRITSLTTTGSGAATLVSNVLNIPTPTLSGLGGIPYTDTVNKIPTTYQGDTAKANIRTSIATYTPQSRTLTINGTTQDLSVNSTYTIPVLDTSIITVWADTLDRLATKNNLNGYVSLSGSYANPTWLSSLAWSKVTSTPTTLSGYGITDATSTARAAISETVTGLDYNNTTGVISQTTGYVIPTTTQQTTWNNKVGGTGANTYLAVWSGSSTLDASPVRTDGSNVGIGVAADPSYKLTMNGPVKTSGVRVDNNDGIANSTLTTINVVTNSGTGLTYNIPGGGYAQDFKEGTTNIMRVSEGKVMVGSITNRGTGKIEVTGGNISVKGLTGETYRWDATSGTPTNTSSPAGWVKINIAGVDAWLPYYQ